MINLRRSPLKRSRLPRSPPNRRGKKVKAWEKARRSLKVEFAAAGIVTCEARLPGCMIDDGLGFAHRLKQRHITTDEERRRVALLCNACHWFWERQGEEKMTVGIDAIIEAREVMI